MVDFSPFTVNNYYFPSLKINGRLFSSFGNIYTERNFAHLKVQGLVSYFKV